MLGFTIIQNEDKKENSSTNNIIYQGGVIGNIIAAVISWHTNQSILWATIHSILGWFYVVYWYFFN